MEKGKKREEEGRGGGKMGSETTFSNIIRCGFMATAGSVESLKTWHNAHVSSQE